MEKEDLLKRIVAVENDLKILNSKNSSSAPAPAPKPEKKKRAQTEYNKFMSSYILEKKNELGDNFKHKIAFSEGAKKWKEEKNKLTV